MVYNEFYAELIALSILMHGDNNIDKIAGLMSKMKKMEYLDPIYIFGAIDKLLKEQKVKSYTVKSPDGLTEKKYAITDRGKYHQKALLSKFYDIQNTIEGFF